MLKLRKVTGHVHAQNAYRVVLVRDDGSELAIGAIGLQVASHQRQYWSWGLYTVLPPPGFPIHGEAVDRDDATAQFKAMWEKFSADPDRLAAFVRDLSRGQR